MPVFMKIRPTVAGLLGFWLVLFASPLRADEIPLIAVASNLRFAIEEIATTFKEETGKSVRFSFGSSGNLTRQVLQGAPYEIFMSADENYALRVFREGKAGDSGRIYAYGRIVVFLPTSSPLSQAHFPEDFKAVVIKASHLRFAIANPELAPYGRAARQALEQTGLWSSLKPYLVYGENIAQAGQFSLSGATFGGIIAYSLAQTPSFRKAGHFQLIPAAWHSPLAQRMVLLKNATGTARTFYDYVQSDTARAIFERHGYSLDAGEDG